MIDLNNFYSGGYFLVRANTPYRSQLKIDWQLEDVISLSPCFCPNQYGLIDRCEDAQNVCEWIDEDEPGKRAEPIPYDFWLLVSYPLVEAS